MKKIRSVLVFFLVFVFVVSPVNVTASENEIQEEIFIEDEKTENLLEEYVTDDIEVQRSDAEEIERKEEILIKETLEDETSEEISMETEEEIEEILFETEEIKEVELDAEIECGEFTLINPLYENVITEEDLVDAEDFMNLQELAMFSTSGTKSYAATIEESGEQLIPQMKERTEVVYATYQDTKLNAGYYKDIWESAFVHNGVSDEGDYLRWGWAGVKAKVSYHKEGEMYCHTFTYTVTYYTTLEQEEIVTEKTDEILAQMNLQGKTDYEKVCAIYDYICRNIAYDKEHEADEDYKLKFSAYAALVDHSAVCQGYALVFYRMCLEEGIDARLIPGKAGSQTHGWNIVKLGNYYYNVDATWDRNYIDNYRYFLKCELNFPGHTRKDEFKTEEFYRKYPDPPADYQNKIENAENLLANADIDLITTTGNIGYSGIPVTLQVKGSDVKDSYTYKYIVTSKEGTSYTIKDFTSSTTAVWVPAETGQKTLSVEIKDAKGSKIIKSMDFTVKDRKDSITFTANPKKQAVSKSKVNLKVEVDGNTEGYTYKFIIYDQKDNWYRLQDFSESSVCTWIPGATGKKTLFVDVKEKNGRVTRQSLEFTVTPELNVAKFENSIGNTITKDSIVTLTAEAVGGNGNIQYKFIIHDEDYNWYKLQDFSNKNTCIWNARMLGNKTLYVDIKDASGTVVRSEAMIVSVEEKPEASAGTYTTIPADTSGSNFANIVLFAYFDGENAAEHEAYFANSKNRAEIMKIYGGPEEVSFTNYLRKVSYGKLRVATIFPQDDGIRIHPYRIKNTSYSAALGSNVDSTIISEMIKNIPEIEGQVLDYDNDGCIDNVTVILCGGAGAQSWTPGGIPSFYAHKSNYDGNSIWSGKAIGAYNFLNTNSVMDTLGSSKSGVVVHEFMHSLGYPDLYNDEESYPVYNWDIMGNVSYKPSYPLAYMRKYVSNWLEIDTITESTSLTLDTQENATGRNAYILKSPLNDQEIFVVEFRKQPKHLVTNYDLDYYIGGSGVIVYRIDTRVEELSNYKGDIGVYVFRPQKGQNGYNEDNRIGVLNAFLSQESGRVSMGSKDMSKTLKDGAIAFKDGTNSGIVISNVSSAAGNTMTIDVTIPDKSEFDAWENLEFADKADTNVFDKNVALKNLNGQLYMAAYKNNGAEVISLYKYEKGTWTKAADDLAAPYVSDLKLEVHSGELYLAYENYQTQILIKKLSGGRWSQIATVKGNQYFDIKSVAGKLYLSYLNDADGNPFKVPAKLAVLENNQFRDLATLQTGFLGQNYICSIDGTIYVSVRNASGDAISVYRYKDGKKEQVSDGSLAANTYDMISANGKIYMSLGNSTNLTLYVYDGKQWSSIRSEIACYEPKLVESEGRIYAMLVPNANDYLKVVRYEEKDGKFIEEGINLDSYSTNMNFTVIGNNLYAAYVRNVDRKIVVKGKETA